MAIQNRRGAYVDFDPTKMVAGEFAVVQSGDENTDDGKALYVAPTTGSVKRIPFADELEGLVEVDDTLTEAGAAADAKKTGDEITALKDDLSDVNERLNTEGLSEDAKQALLACFENVTWKNEDGQEYYNALEAALYPDVGLVSISAVFNSGTTKIYTDTPLNDLKAYLTVTALYNDGSSQTIQTYALSGTLVEGQSTITVSYEQKNTTFIVTVLDVLDKIAYGNVSYRELFETNNIITIGDFEDATISSTEQILENGDSYKVNYGNPLISQEAVVSGSHSLKVTETDTSSQLKYVSSRIPRSGTLLIGVCVRVDSYTSGIVGVQFNLQAPSITPDPIPITVACGISRVTTEGAFEPRVVTRTYDVSEYVGSGVAISSDTFFGEFSSGKANAYLDLVVITQIPNDMSLSVAEELYSNYVNMKKN